MNHCRANRRIPGLLMIATLLFVTVMPARVFAGMVSTDSAIVEQATTADRDQLREQLNREEVRVQLEGMGVNPDNAIERVAAMTDSEVRTLSDGIGAVPAGADVSVGVALLLIILVVLIVR